MDIHAYTGHRALIHLGALRITPYVSKQNLRRERARNHPKARVRKNS